MPENFHFLIGVALILTITRAVQIIIHYQTGLLLFNVHGSVYRNNILVYNSNYMHKSQSLFYLTTALHVSGVTITHPQEHKTTVNTVSVNHYTVLLTAAVVEDFTSLSHDTLPR
jgi:hypothetical protein